MSEQERDDLVRDMRAVTSPLTRWFIGGTLTVCCTAVACAVYVKSSIQIHEYRITQTEKVNEKQDGQIQTLLLNSKITKK